MVVGAILLFAILFHFILQGSLKLGGKTALLVGSFFGLFIYGLTLDLAIAFGASLVATAYTL